MLSECKPSLIIEFWDEFQREYGSSCAEMAAFLQEFGYKLFWITDNGLVPYSAASDTHLPETPINVLAVY